MRPVVSLYSLLLAAFSLLPVNAAAQYENLLNKTYAERAEPLWQILDSLISEPDSARAMGITDSLTAFARRHQDTPLELEAELYAVYYIIRRHGTNTPEWRVLPSLESIRQRAADAKALTVHIKTGTVLADYYWMTGSYELAMEEYNKLAVLLEPVSIEYYPEKSRVLYFIGKAYYSFRDYPQAVRYFLQVQGLKAVDRFQHFIYVQSLSHTIHAYRELGRLDSSDHYIGLLDEYATRRKDTNWIAIVKGDQGLNAYLHGQYEQAVPLLEACINRGLVIQDWGLASGSKMTLAELYFKQGRNKEAAAASLEAADMVRRSGQYHRYRTLYPLLVKMHAQKGQWQLAARYTDSTVLAIDSLGRQYSGLLLARVLQKAAIAEQKARLTDIENKKRELTFRFIVFLVLATGALLVTLFVYRNKRLRHRQEQLVKDMELKEATSALTHARAQLGDFAGRIAEKNKLLESMEAKFGNSSALEELEKSIILTGADWRKFRELFEQVHPGYLDRLNEKIPGISPSEVRMMTLARLNFSNKEMAAALGVTAQAMRVTWHRLRKKLNLPEEGTLEELANQV